jgi:hypothetical protein
VRVAVALVLAGMLAVPAVAAAPKHVTKRGVGRVKLHRTYKRLRAKHLLGPMLQGCDAAGPKARAAALRPPLEGAVDLTRSAPRRVKSIIVSGGATARGVAIGDTRDDIVAAYPKATFDRSTQEVFGITLVRIPKDGGGRLQMALRKGKVTRFGIPFIEFCE